MKNLKQVCLIISSLMLLSACGGGGSSDDTPPTGNNVSVSNKNFSVSLKNIDIRRVSNDESIDVNTAGVSSGTLILRQ